MFPEVSHYDFWGFGDMDVILGDMRHFITNDVLSDNDVIGNMGHLQIFRNKKEINEIIFETPADYLYKVITDASKNYFFDEREYSRFNLYKSDRKKLIWDDVADIRKPSRSIKCINFTFAGESIDNNKQCCFYDFKNRRLYALTRIRKQVTMRELIYVHIQKRTMKNCLCGRSSSFLILPNRFIECNSINECYKKYKRFWSNLIVCFGKNLSNYLKHIINRVKKN